jgi:hypothetical protein
MSGHIALIGDSVFDNKAYVGRQPDVVEHLRAHYCRRRGERRYSLSTAARPPIWNPSLFVYPGMCRMWWFPSAATMR